MAGPGPANVIEPEKQRLALPFDGGSASTPRRERQPPRTILPVPFRSRAFRWTAPPRAGQESAMDWLLPLLLAIFGPGLVQSLVPGAAPPGGAQGVTIPLAPLAADESGP